MFQVGTLETITNSLSNTTWDLLVIFFFLATGFFYGLSMGKTRLFSILFSLYISILIFENFTYLNSFIENKKDSEVLMIKIFTFLLFFVLLVLLLNRSLFKKTKNIEKIWQIFLLSFLEVGLFASALLNLLPLEKTPNLSFSPITKLLFASEQSYFWWLVLPLLSLSFIVKRQKKEKK